MNLQLHLPVTAVECAAARPVEDAIVTVCIRAEAFAAVMARLKDPAGSWYLVSCCQVIPDGYSVVMRRK